MSDLRVEPVDLTGATPSCSLSPEAALAGAASVLSIAFSQNDVAYEYILEGVPLDKRIAFGDDEKHLFALVVASTGPRQLWIASVPAPTDADPAARRVIGAALWIAPGHTFASRIEEYAEKQTFSFLRRYAHLVLWRIGYPWWDRRLFGRWSSMGDAMGPPHEKNVGTIKCEVDKAGKPVEAPADLARRARTGEERAVSEGAKTKEVTVPHHYLFMVGVLPEFRGSDLHVGTNLLEPMLKQAAEDNMTIYLESTNPRNWTFYRRLGFIDDMDDVVLAPGHNAKPFIKRAAK
ncbi:hypothetical protein DFJ74DRAFT_710520 [Hyaloraphidium curvatum]|nr:hypothetical protein DFJ74DRAFT_710520 [Hyaloraphidium curvatum]